MEYALALGGGMLLGMFYFGGLWWTTQKLVAVAHPLRLSLGSFILRTIVLLAGLYVIMDGQWQRLLMSLGGIIIVKIGFRGLVALQPRSVSQEQSEGGQT